MELTGANVENVRALEVRVTDLTSNEQNFILVQRRDSKVEPWREAHYRELFKIGVSKVTSSCQVQLLNRTHKCVMVDATEDVEGGVEAAGAVLASPHLQLWQLRPAITPSLV